MRVVVSNNNPNRVVYNSTGNVSVKVQPTSETKVVVGTTDTTGALLKSNNLSDLPAPKTARNNLALGSMALKAATSYVEQTGGKFDILGRRSFPRPTFYDAGQVSNSSIHAVTTANYGVYKAKAPSGIGLGVTFNLTFTGTYSDNSILNSSPFGTAMIFRVILEDFISASTTFTSVGSASNIKWDGGSEPTFSGSGKIDVIEFMSVDGGTVWYAKMLYSNITA